MTEPMPMEASGRPDADVIEAAGPSNIHLELMQLAHRCTSAPAYYRQAFRAVAQWIRAPYAAMTLRFSAELVDDYWHTGGDDPGFWKFTTQDLLNDAIAEGRPRLRVYRAKDGEDRVAIIAAPFLDLQGAPIGALACVVNSQAEGGAHGRLAEIRAIATLISYCAAEIDSNNRAAVGRVGQETTDTLAHAAESADRVELAMTITNSLRNRLGCDQVALSLVRRQQARVLSISGFDEVRSRNPGVRRIKSAMDECVDRGRPILCQEESDWDDDGAATGHRLHRQWHRATGGQAVASVPLFAGGECVAIVSLLARPGELLTRELLARVAAQVSPYVPALQLIETARRNLVVHAMDSARSAVANTFRPASLGRRLLILAGFAAAVWFCIGTVPYRITVPCGITPAEVQHVVAPQAGILIAAHVVAGDRVTTGTILYELDTRELELERARLEAALAVSNIDVHRAVARGDTVAASLERAEQGVLEAQLQIVRDKIDRSVGRATRDGTIIAGDLRKHTGQVIARGAPMFVIAPARGWTAELYIPESVVEHLEAGARGVLACDARPERRHAIRLDRILPQAQDRNERPVFVAEAELEQPEAWMRPGMEGVARLDGGSRPVWWVVGHRFINAVRRALWL